MTLDWMPRDNEPKNHLLHTDAHWGTKANAPCAVYEKRPLTDPKGNVQDGLNVAFATALALQAGLVLTVNMIMLGALVQTGTIPLSPELLRQVRREKPSMHLLK